MRGVPKQNGSGRGVRANRGRGGHVPPMDRGLRRRKPEITPTTILSPTTKPQVKTTPARRRRRANRGG